MIQLSPEDALIRDAIVAAKDVVDVDTWEDITEPKGAAQHMKRITRKDQSSATVEVGKTYRQDYIYVNPPSSPAWGALARIDESILS